MSKLIKNVHTILSASSLGRIALAVLWGIGLAALFRKTCKKKNCTTYVLPRNINIKEDIFEFNDECYKFLPYEFDSC